MATKEEILDSISALTVLELKELLDAFEERFGVTAAAPVAVAAAAAPAGGGAAAPAEARRRTSSTSSSPAPAPRRSRSSRPSASSPAWASRRPRTSSTAPPSPSSRRPTRTPPRPPRPSSRTPARPSRSSDPAPEGLPHNRRCARHSDSDRSVWGAGGCVSPSGSGGAPSGKEPDRLAAANHRRGGRAEPADRRHAVRAELGTRWVPDALGGESLTPGTGFFTLCRNRIPARGAPLCGRQDAG